MLVKKMGKKVYGASLSEEETKAMNMEIQRQLASFERLHGIELEAMVLYSLHEIYGFGPKRLKEFHDHFAPSLQELLNRYEMEHSDQAWLCTRKLKDKGIDIEEWNK